MRRAAWMALFALLLAAAAPAAEKAGPEVTKKRETSTIAEITGKPLYVYSVRRRPDPFVPFWNSLTVTAEGASEFSVTELRLVGFVGNAGDQVVLFRQRLGTATYSLRRGRLYSPDNRAVPNVSGRVKSPKEVLLVQGERRMVFNAFSSNR